MKHLSLFGVVCVLCLLVSVTARARGALDVLGPDAANKVEEKVAAAVAKQEEAALDAAVLGGQAANLAAAQDAPAPEKKTRTPVKLSQPMQVEIGKDGDMFVPAFKGGESLLRGGDWDEQVEQETSHMVEVVKTYNPHHEPASANSSISVFSYIKLICLLLGWLILVAIAFIKSAKDGADMSIGETIDRLLDNALARIGTDENGCPTRSSSMHVGDAGWRTNERILKLLLIARFSIFEPSMGLAEKVGIMARPAVERAIKAAEPYVPKQAIPVLQKSQEVAADLLARLQQVANRIPMPGGDRAPGTELGATERLVNDEDDDVQVLPPDAPVAKPQGYVRKPKSKANTQPAVTTDAMELMAQRLEAAGQFEVASRMRQDMQAAQQKGTIPEEVSAPLAAPLAQCTEEVSGDVMGAFLAADEELPPPEAITTPFLMADDEPLEALDGVPGSVQPLQAPTLNLHDSDLDLVL